MRVYARTGPNTGVSLGCLGTLLLSPLLAVYWIGAMFVQLGRLVAYGFRRR